MPKPPLPSAPLLIGGRRFEPSRLQHQLWAEAYQHLVPGRPAVPAARSPQQATGPAAGRARGHTTGGAPPAAPPPGGICA